MANTKDILLGKLKLKVLACGPSGTGKTLFAGGFPKPFFIDFDDGMLTLHGMDVDYQTIKKWTDVGPLVNKLLEDKEHETIVFDSITRLSRMLMARVQKLNAAAGKGRATLAGMGAPPSVPEYGIYFNNFVDMLDDVMGVDKHIIFTAHLDHVKDEESGELLGIYPLVMTKLRLQIADYFDECYRFYVEKRGQKTNYCLTTVQDRKHQFVKTRLKGVLPEVMDNPSYNKIMECIRKFKV